jgi:DNA invertase Pin-like site-specific DNA recombinase
MNAIQAAAPEGSLKRAVSYLRVSTSAQADTDYNSEGYSIPAQREANLKAAEREGAIVVAEFIDRGESAKTADREGLRELLAYIAANPVDLVIVHKVDRLARNRVDDVEIGLAIRRAGARLISATENIDETPSGKLLHGVMSAVAEFYSLNLATEAKKGMRQKAKSGGTPGRAPLGYLNVREMVEGREIRTIAIDPERAPHIVWAFEAYATGEWTIFQLTEELNRRGLRTKKSAKTPERPLYHSHVEKLLNNPYYAGMVSYEGVEYQGRHEPLISRELFEKVQAVKQARPTHGRRSASIPITSKEVCFVGIAAHGSPSPTPRATRATSTPTGTAWDDSSTAPCARRALSR